MSVCVCVCVSVRVRLDAAHVAADWLLYALHKDWAARRVGFAKADHSQDGEVEGAIDSPEAALIALLCSSPRLPPRHNLAKEGSLIAGAPLSRKGACVATPRRATWVRQCFALIARQQQHLYREHCVIVSCTSQDLIRMVQLKKKRCSCP